MTVYQPLGIEHFVLAKLAALSLTLTESLFCFEFDFRAVFLFLSVLHNLVMALLDALSLYYLEIAEAAIRLH